MCQQPNRRSLFEIIVVHPPDPLCTRQKVYHLFLERSFFASFFVVQTVSVVVIVMTVEQSASVVGKHEWFFVELNIHHLFIMHFVPCWIMMEREM